MMSGEEVKLSSDYYYSATLSRDSIDDVYSDSEAGPGDTDDHGLEIVSQVWGAESQNVLTLSLLLCLALLTNLSAAPVILFRRTR